ncbi:MAG: ABC transporter ATP-binding protein [Oscillospiraceae bacterium]|nr:ABC transporter ATP-binding protein [Oscillospiraceae bacterium]
MDIKRPGTAPPIIGAEHLSFAYDGEKDASLTLQDISLQVEKGEFLCILGPSGCGKSTLLNLIAGFLKPTAGTVKMDGEPIMGPDKRRGVVFQSPALYAWLNVRDNVGFALKMQNVPRTRTRELTERYIRLVGLEGYERHKPYELSGGMRQRVALARAMVNRPEILLMDEPFGALDALTRKNMQDLVRSIWAETENTFLMITHDVEEAMALSTRTIVMSPKPGRLVETFRPDLTYRLLSGEGDKARYDPAYMEMRSKILSVITGQREEPSSLTPV